MASTSTPGDEKKAPDGDRNHLSLARRRKRYAVLKAFKAVLYVLRLKSRKSKRVQVNAALSSPMAASISCVDSVGDISRYMSPSNEGVHITEPGKEECWLGDEGGDEMIDAKAEEFIAQFYRQMRIQNSMN
ncbi:hypothetical protein V6N13_061019 [Hibiscus sabdariffa]|uniref:Uncharacterized protein n=2 Tax=Hibiscus sabdariffa TaxID=183260 RepID=A0ABR2AYU2_9ROSI